MHRVPPLEASPPDTGVILLDSPHLFWWGLTPTDGPQPRRHLAFRILMDRVPIFLGVVAIYFGFRITSWATGGLFFLAMAGSLVLTMPHRQGIALALSDLSRVYFRDPSDPLPRED